MVGRFRFIMLNVFSAILLTPGTPSLAAASSAKFRQACERQLSGFEADTRAMVADWQKRADTALASRDAAKVARALEEAGSLTTNVAGYSGSIFLKCLGESTYHSYLKTYHRLYEFEARHDPKNIRSVIQAALFDAVNNPGKDANSVLTSIPVEARTYRTAMDTCEGNLRGMEYYRENGAFVLPEEEALESISKKVIAQVEGEAKRQMSTALANEDAEFNRAATQQEKQAAASVAGASQMAKAMTGVDIGNEMSPQLMTLDRQASASREWLRKASAWEFKPGDSSQSFARAEKRGDTLLARANDKSRDLALRDKLYGHAQRYYEWCNCRDKAARAETAHDAMMPALEARQEQQRERLERAQAEMKQKSAGMQEAIDDMKKTEAEKQQFKNEAEALEEELGF